MASTPSFSKDIIAKPPKKRPFALFNHTLEVHPGLEDDENMQPEDLSMKSSRVHPPSQTSAEATLLRPATPIYTPPGYSKCYLAPSTEATASPSAHSSYYKSCLTSAAPLTPSVTPTATQRSEVGSLFSYVSGGLNLSASNRSQISPIHRDNNITNSSFDFNTNMKTISNNHSFNNSLATGNNSLMSSAGLRLISEVAAACGRPTVLRAPGGTSEATPPPPPPSSHNAPRRTYAPPTPRDPLRTAIRDRGVGVRSWHYHPYLPLGVYGLPSSLHSPSTPPATPKRDMATPVSTRPRGGSVSPPGETGSSSSESSPEGQQADSRSPRLSCPNCNRRYATVAGLAKHHQFHCLKDANRSFACKHCEKVYTSLGALKMHIRTHTLPCKCPLCGKAFSRPWLLQGHIRTHTGEKPFQCPQCDRCFADRSNLRAHLQTHTDVKKYACRTCPKTFSRMSLLVKHEDHGCPGMRVTQPLSLASEIQGNVSPVIVTSQPSVHTENRYHVESRA